MIKNTFRIANRMDIVPKLPMPPGYEHVLAINEVNPVQLLPLPPKILVKFDFGCEHYLDTYLYLLSLEAGGPVLAAGCRHASLERVSEEQENSGCQPCPTLPHRAQNRRQGLPDAEATPFATTSAEIDLSRVLDISNGQVRKTLRVSLQRVLHEPHAPGLPESITQAIGRITFFEGYHGLLVPSAANPGHLNLVVFPEKLLPRQLRVVNADKLPR